MKFATIGHLFNKENLKYFPKPWIQNNLVISPEMNINGTIGHITGLLLTAEQMMTLPREKVRHSILDAACFLQEKFNVDLIQLGALTTSVSEGGKWVVEQKEYHGFTNHGDSYTAAVTCQVVLRAAALFHKKIAEQTLAIVGAYGVIGEAVSKILVPQFGHTMLIGRRAEKLSELEPHLKGDYETTVDLKTRKADIIVTATSHPTGLLACEHLKKNAIVIDVSQPPNMSYDLCRKRPDVCRIDGGYVDFPKEHHLPIPGVPPGKLFACIVEVIMQAMENERKNHVGSIDLNHLKKTEQWGEKYGFTLNELTNFGESIQKSKKA
jgi:fatty aldehyde-generating acyl-ACP reductase